MELTKPQLKQVIEFFAATCAEEMPAEEVDQYEHLRGRRLEASAAGGVALAETLWDALVFALVDAQQLDRDPGGHLNNIGVYDTAQNRESWKNYYDDVIGRLIDELA